MLSDVRRLPLEAASQTLAMTGAPRMASRDPNDAEGEYLPNDVENQLEMDIIDTLNCQMQQSVNDALVSALDPITGQLLNYTHQGWLPVHLTPGQDPTPANKDDTSDKRQSNAHGEAFDNLRRKREGDHDYSALHPSGSPTTLNTSSSTYQDTEASHTYDSDNSDKPGPSKKKPVAPPKPP
ncbi:hypothetical protein NDU88_001421 [Pleurodeles waltl]|uniref:Uncharacterized protein n=1 Tax=Pleurodeles waltl TaxID=8319 RepID=A0AAV7QA21_PLEWA|nr:hypothetical protein NDU88_001421 [Pleurodeles waltl]